MFDLRMPTVVVREREAKSGSNAAECARDLPSCCDALSAADQDALILFLLDL